MNAARIVAICIAAFLWTNGAVAQPESVRDQLVGTWNLVIAEVTARTR